MMARNRTIDMKALLAESGVSESQLFRTFPKSETHPRKKTGSAVNQIATLAYDDAWRQVNLGLAAKAFDAPATDARGIFEAEFANLWDVAEELGEVGRAAFMHWVPTRLLNPPEEPIQWHRPFQSPEQVRFEQRTLLLGAAAIAESDNVRRTSPNRFARLFVSRITIYFCDPLTRGSDNARQEQMAAIKDDIDFFLGPRNTKPVGVSGAVFPDGHTFF